eukprot:830751-Karenia_brevis.AAC.1
MKFPAAMVSLPVHAKKERFVNKVKVPAKKRLDMKHIMYLPHLMFHWLLAYNEDFVNSILNFKPA